MSELRRLKMKIGDAEFEADVHPMYDQFLSMLRQRTHTPERAVAGQPDRSAFEQNSLMRIFDLRQDGTIVLKMLPDGPDRSANTMLLLLYGYSGLSVRRPTNECARCGRVVVRNGQQEGTHYALNSQGLAMAKHYFQYVRKCRAHRLGAIFEFPAGNSAFLQLGHDRTYLSEP